MEGRVVEPFRRNVPYKMIRYDDITIVLKAIISLYSDRYTSRTLRNKVNINGQRLSYINQLLYEVKAVDIIDIACDHNGTKRQYIFKRNIKNEDEIPIVLTDIRNISDERKGMQR